MIGFYAMHTYNWMGAAMMAALGIVTYIVLNLIAKSLDRKARKEWEERNNKSLFDIDP